MAREVRKFSVTVLAGTLQFTNAAIVTNAAAIVLNGPAARIVNQSGADALANFECETTSMHDGGDHVIFVGRVLALRTTEGRPLLYYRGAYRQIVDPS